MKNEESKPQGYYDQPKGCERKVMFIVAIFIAIAVLFSCEKVEDWCWDCLWIKTDLFGRPDIEEIVPICNKTVNEIRDIEDTYTYQVCFESSIMRCTQKQQR